MNPFWLADGARAYDMHRAMMFLRAMDLVEVCETVATYETRQGGHHRRAALQPAPVMPPDA